MEDFEDYELRLVAGPADWATYHRIRRTVLYDVRGRRYDENHPDDRHKDNRPLLLIFRTEGVGVTRLDCPAAGTTGIIRSVAIDPLAQRRGHGRALISLVARMAHRLGFSALEVNSAADAVGFYRRLEFELIDPHRESPLLRLDLRSFKR